MLEIAILSFTTLFATIGPIDAAIIFAGLTGGLSTKSIRHTAFKGFFISLIILLIFAFAGDFLIKSLGVSLAAFKASGGILLLMIAINMIFVRPDEGTATKEEMAEANNKSDISVFPLATPLIAGPGAMGAIILLMADNKGDYLAQAVVITSLLVVLLITLICLLLAGQIKRILGVSGTHIIMRVVGILLAALSVQFIFDGIRESMIFG